MEIRNAFPEAFGDLVTAKWKYGDSDEKMAELLRVAEMEGAHAVAVVDGVTHSGTVSKVSVDHIIIGGTGFTLPLWQIGWTVTVAAPKPADPGADIPDGVVEAALAAIPWASDHQLADVRAALAAADAKRAELEGQA